MNKKAFVRSLCEQSGLMKGDGYKIVDLVFEHLKAKLLEGQEVRIEGLGTFIIKFREPRIQRDNLAGCYREMPRTVKLKFRVAPTMQQELNDSLLSEDEDADFHQE